MKKSTQQKLEAKAFNRFKQRQERIIDLQMEKVGYSIPYIAEMRKAGWVFNENGYASNPRKAFDDLRIIIHDPIMARTRKLRAVWTPKLSAGITAFPLYILGAEMQIDIIREKLCIKI